MTNTKITYLLGAGASALALPVVADMPHRMLVVLNYLKETPDYVINASAITNDHIRGIHGQQQGFYKDFEWLIENTKKHASVDTFAKKLFITKKRSDLLRLKALLTIYFILEQQMHDADPRYDSFIASLIEPGPKMPPNVKILTWNYDFQFEKAYSAYSENNTLHENQRELRVTPSDFPSPSTDHFSISKLNGTTSVYTTERGGTVYQLLKDMSSKPTFNLLVELLQSYHNLKVGHDQYESMLCFAWENSHHTKFVLDEACEDVNGTEVLVVIGYSFPFFNRLVDRRIIGSMPKLKKIYFQAPDEGADIMRNSFRSIRDFSDANIGLLRQTDKFFLPHEL
jgi:hypothetical protein